MLAAMVTSRETHATPFRTWIERAEQLGARGRFEIGVPMRDGIELAADVYLPAGANEEPVPAIVTVTPWLQPRPAKISKLYSVSA